MDSTTEDYHCLCLDNTVQSNALNDCIFWYKAPFRTPTALNFQVGCRAYHQFAKRRGKKEDILPEESPNPNTVTSNPVNPKKPKVVVKKVLK